MIRLGIDNGNYNTKSSDGALYASGYETSLQPPVSDRDVLIYDGRYYSIGAKRDAVQYDKTRDDEALLLTLPALAISMELARTREDAFILGVGLPLMAYSAQRAAFRDYFLHRGRLKFHFRGTAYSAEILDCRVYPQGYAAYLSAYNDYSRYRDVTFIDIGGYTADIFRTRGGQLVPGSTVSLQTGTITLLTAIKAELSRQDIRLDDEQIAYAIQQGRTDHRRAEIVMRAISEARAAYVRQLINTLREHGIDTDMPVALIGGGAELLAATLKQQMYVVGTLDKFANARGYRLWLDREKV